MIHYKFYTPFYLLEYKEGDNVFIGNSPTERQPLKTGVNFVRLGDYIQVDGVQFEKVQRIVATLDYSEWEKV